MEEAYKGAGVVPGMEVWRIEKMAPVKQDFQGKLYSGDSYIFLVTMTDPKKNLLSHNLHMWLGEESSQDERGVCAYKTVELDAALGGGPVQYRECQGYESSLFMSYFKESGIEYLDGGIESGFKHVERGVYPTRLLHLKGSRCVRIKEVEAVNTSLCKDDCFILDKGSRLYVWEGPEANRTEKAKALEAVRKIRDDERGANAEITFLWEDPNNAEFWETLGGKIDVTNTSGPDDDETDQAMSPRLELNQVSDESGELVVTPIEKIDGKYLSKDMLKTEDVFVLDIGSEVFAWIGKHTTVNEKKESMKVATQFVENSGRPRYTPVTRVMEDHESPKFKSFFKYWAKTQTEKENDANDRTKPIDFEKLRVHKQATEVPVDDGSGQVKIWRIENMQKVDLPMEQYGQFYGGDSYIILYTYMQGTREEYIIYFWLGNDSSKDEQGAAALLTVALDQEMGDAPVQVRVTQGKEPLHFRMLFKGNMVVHLGGVPSGFKNSQELANEEETKKGNHLYHVKSSPSVENSAGCVEIPCEAKGLNSGDCFIVKDSSNVYVWSGEGASDEERRVSVEVGEKLQEEGMELIALKETTEPEAFWDALGGKTEYPRYPEGSNFDYEPRLFQCTNTYGSMDVNEISNFTQEDLIDDDVMLLDTYNTVFVWIGTQSNEEERREAVPIAQNFIASMAEIDGRDLNTPIISFGAGREPTSFSSFFLGWDHDYMKKKVFLDPYEAKMEKLRAERAAKLGMDPVEEVKSEPSVVVAKDGNIDPEKRESYLSDAEFQETFKMSKDEFYKLQKWRQIKLKKDANLF